MQLTNDLTKFFDCDSVENGKRLFVTKRSARKPLKFKSVKPKKGMNFSLERLKMKKIEVTQLRGQNGGIMFGQEEVAPGQFRVNEILVHQGPHFDEAVAVMIIRQIGDDFFPGVDEASVSFIPHGSISSYEELKKGRLLVGVGDSPFNEHETEGRGEVVNHCAASLVAHLLATGIDTRCLGRLVEDTRREDLSPNGSVGHVASVMKAMLETGGTDQDVLNFGIKAAEAVYLSAVDFHESANQGFEESVKAHRIGNIRVAVIPFLEPAYTRKAFAKKFDLVVAFGATGNVFVGVRRGGNVLLGTLWEIFRFLVIGDMEGRGMRVPEDYKRVGAELPAQSGSLYLFEKASCILNKEGNEPIALNKGQVLQRVNFALRNQPQQGERFGRYKKSEICSNPSRELSEELGEIFRKDN